MKLRTGHHPVMEITRRPLKSRQRRWAQWLAAALNSYGVPPNVVSSFSLLFAALAATCLLMVRRREGVLRIILLLGAAAGVQLRLLCNLLDGLIAVEGGRRTPTGELFNEVPDRIADPLLLVSAGYAAGNWMGAPQIGWLAAVLALMTAYVRVLGGALGFPQNFAGPMAKPQRMAILTAACLLACFETHLGLRGQMLTAGLWIIVLGSTVTVCARLDGIVQQLRKQ